MNARCENLPFSVEEYTLLRLKHVPNKDAYPKCDGLGTIARSEKELIYGFSKPIVFCPCRTVVPRKVKVLKGFTPGNLELLAGDEVEVYGWPHTSGRLTLCITGSGSVCHGGYVSVFRTFLQEGYFRFIDVSKSDVPHTAGASIPDCGIFTDYTGPEKT